jgi:hypothetical protein
MILLIVIERSVTGIRSVMIALSLAVQVCADEPGNGLTLLP